MINNGVLIKRGLDLVCQLEISLNNLSVTGETVAFNIQRKSDGLWWTGATFVAADEPGALFAATEVTITKPAVTPTGIYEYTLTAGFTSSSERYIVHYTSGVTVVGDQYLPAGIDGAQDSGLDTVNTELAGVPPITASLREQIKWIFTLGRNRLTETSILQTIRNDADTGDIATRPMADDGTTFDSGKAT